MYVPTSSLHKIIGKDDSRGWVHVALWLKWCSKKHEEGLHQLPRVELTGFQNFLGRIVAHDTYKS